MALKIHVPSLDGQDAAQHLKETLLTSEPEAQIKIDVDDKTVTVESAASEETFKQLIVAAGHEVAGV